MTEIEGINARKREEIKFKKRAMALYTCVDKGYEK